MISLGKSVVIYLLSIICRAPPTHVVTGTRMSGWRTKRACDIRSKTMCGISTWASIWEWDISHCCYLGVNRGFSDVLFWRKRLMENTKISNLNLSKNINNALSRRSCPPPPRLFVPKVSKVDDRPSASSNGVERFKHLKWEEACQYISNAYFLHYTRAEELLGYGYDQESRWRFQWPRDLLQSHNTDGHTSDCCEFWLALSGVFTFGSYIREVNMGEGSSKNVKVVEMRNLSIWYSFKL